MRPPAEPRRATPRPDPQPSRGTSSVTSDLTTGGELREDGEEAGSHSPIPAGLTANSRIVQKHRSKRTVSKRCTAADLTSLGQRTISVSPAAAVPAATEVRHTTDAAQTASRQLISHCFLSTPASDATRDCTCTSTLYRCRIDVIGEVW